MTKLILVRGLPGSGKSTLAKDIAYSPEYMHFEADMFWMVDGEYKFDISKIKLAHEWCQNKTHESLNQGIDVVVSNTFTTKKELAPYFEIAREFKIVPQVITCQSQYGNIHNVPREVLDRMQDRWEWDISELYN